MPRRNLRFLLFMSLLCLVCASQVSRRGRILLFAMREIEARGLKEVEEAELFEGALEGMTGRLDKYSGYISPAMLAQFEEIIEREFGGVGIEIMPDPDNQQLTVACPLYGTPAHLAGIRPGDKILRIDGESTQGLTPADASDRIRGTPGEPVVLDILHPGEEQPVAIEVVRAVIHVDTVQGDTRNSDGSWNFFLEGHDSIGYLYVSSFSEKTAEEFRNALEQLTKQGMTGLILDLRDNPGGLLTTGIAICDALIDPNDPKVSNSSVPDPGVIVSTRSRDGTIRDTYRATSAGTFNGFPMVVLVNDQSASASEIVAGCLQDYRRAVVVGERTYGKGTVQEIIELRAGQGKLKLTTLSYWRPSDKDIHRHEDSQDWGVSPDPGCRVPLDVERRRKLLLARLLREFFKANEDAGVAVARDLPDPHDDAQLIKAIEVLQRKLD